MLAHLSDSDSDETTPVAKTKKSSESKSSGTPSSGSVLSPVSSSDQKPTPPLVSVSSSTSLSSKRTPRGNPHVPSPRGRPPVSPRQQSLPSGLDAMKKQQGSDISPRPTDDSMSVSTSRLIDEVENMLGDSDNSSPSSSAVKARPPQGAPPKSRPNRRVLRGAPPPQPPDVKSSTLPSGASVEYKSGLSGSPRNLHKNTKGTAALMSELTAEEQAVLASALDG